MSGFDQHIPITPPSLKESNSISTPVVSHSSKNEDNRNDIMSPMKDWNMFYDDTNDVILYQNPFGDELTIKDKIHNEIEKFIRGDDEIDIFWNNITDIETIHKENIVSYNDHPDNKNKGNIITNFTQDDLNGIFNDYFTDDMDNAMEAAKKTATEDSRIPEKEKTQTLRDAERYVSLRDAVNERIKQYNVQQKGETGGGKRKTKKRKGGMPSKKTKKRKAGMPSDKTKKIKPTRAQKYHRISTNTANTYPNLSNAFYDRSLEYMEAASDRTSDSLPRPYYAERHAISPIPEDIERRTISPMPPIQPNVTRKGGKRKTKKTRKTRKNKRKSSRRRH
jgi:hypothetical protein